MVFYVNADGAADAFQRYSAGRSNLRPLYNRYADVADTLQMAQRHGISRNTLEHCLSKARRLKGNLYDAQWWGEKQGRWNGLPAHIAQPCIQELDYLIGWNYRITNAAYKRAREIDERGSGVDDWVNSGVWKYQAS